MSEQNFGLVRQSTGTAVLKPIPVPSLRPDYVLVRTIAIALNPTDWTTLDAPGDNGTLVGCDYAGIVEEVGSAVKRKFKPGERVCGFAHGANDANPENGAFARFIAVKGDLQMHIPDSVSFEAAATVGVGIGTVGYALYKVLQLPFPDTARGPNDGCNSKEDREPILIYGGSTATGTLAIQFAKLSGRKVITTCSPRHFELVTSRGADEVYNYRDPDVGEKIRITTKNALTTVFDTVSLVSTAAICSAAIASSLSSGKAKYCNLLGVDFPRSGVESIYFLGYSLSGESFIFEGDTYQAQPEDFVFGTEFAKITEKLWMEGRWVTHPPRICKGGLAGIVEGMQALKEGKVSGEKLVYRIDEKE